MYTENLFFSFYCCSEIITCAMRPTIFLFFLVRKERWCRARYQKEKNAGRGHDLLSPDISLADNGQPFCPVRRTIHLWRIHPRSALPGSLFEHGEPRFGRVVLCSSEVQLSG